MQNVELKCYFLYWEKMYIITVIFTSEPKNQKICQIGVFPKRKKNSQCNQSEQMKNMCLEYMVSKTKNMCTSISNIDYPKLKSLSEPK